MEEFSSWNVIIVDDEPDNVGVIELVLDFHEVRHRTAASGQECLQLLRQETPTLLLVDIQMPGMSGYELLDHIQQQKQWQNISTIAITAHTMSGDEERIRAAGFNGYIPKPINVMTLMDDIKGFLNQ